MHLILPRNDEKRMVHLNQLVKMATGDIEKGKEYLPRELYDRLKDLAEKFYDTYRELSRCNGRKMVAVAARNKTTQRLCFLVRDVYVMARRKYERGDYGDAILAQHGIPKVPIKDTAQKRIWVTLAEEILVGDAEYSTAHPTILRDPTREDLEVAKEAASDAHGEFHAANTQLGRVQMEMQHLRKQAQALLISAKHAIVAGFFELRGPLIREVLFAYGYRFKPAPVKKESGLIKLKPTSKPKPRRKRQVPQDHAFNYAPPLPQAATRPGPKAEPSGDQTRKTQAAVIQPAAPQPAAPQPATPQPAAPQPATPQPAATQPAATQPAATQPAATQPAATQPQQPKSTQTPETQKFDPTTLKNKTLKKAITIQEEAPPKPQAKTTTQKPKAQGKQSSTKAQREKKKQERQNRKNSRKRK